MSGYSKRECKEKCVQEFGLKPSGAQALMNRAFEFYAQDGNDTFKDCARQLLIDRFDELYSAAAGSDDLSTAARSLENLAKIFGVYDNKLELNVNAEITFDFGGEENEV